MSIHDFIRRHPVAVAACLAVIALGACVNVGMAFVVQSLVAELTSGNLAAHPESAWGAVAYLVPWAMTDYAWVAFVYHLVGRYQADVRLDCAAAVEGARVPSMVRISRDPDAFRTVLVNDAGLLGADYLFSFFRAGYDIVVFAATVAATGLIDPAFIPFVVSLSLVSAILPRFAERLLSDAQRRFSDDSGELAAQSSRIADGMESLVSCRCANRAWEELSASVDAVRRSFVRRILVREGVVTLSISLGKLVTYGIWGIGALAVAGGSIDLAKLVALAQLMTVLQEPLQEISILYSNVISGRALVAKVTGLTKEGAAVGAAPAAVGAAPADGLACVGLAVDDEGGEPVLAAASLAVPLGARVLVEGPSGAGKTTLLRALAGTVPSAGEVWLSGRRLGPDDDRAGRVALVTQRTFTVAADLAGCMDPGGSGPAGLAARAAAAAWPGVLGPLATRIASDPAAPSSSLSGGEAKRLHLLRGLLAVPEALLLDEVCAGLEPASAAAALAEVNASAVPVVLAVVHDLPGDASSLGFTHRLRVGSGKVGPLEELEPGPGHAVAHRLFDEGHAAEECESAGLNPAAR